MRQHDVLGLLLPNIPEFVPALHGGLLAGLTVTFANPLYTAGMLDVPLEIDLLSLVCQLQ